MTKLFSTISLLYIFSLWGNMVSSQGNDDYFIIKVVDQKTGRGVPMVELRTLSQRLYITDSNGIIAFDDTNLMNQRVTFTLFCHGYECPTDWVVRDAIPGTSTIIEIKCKNIAERLYRITGQDIYGESSRAGLFVPIKHQGLNGKVLGQDTFIETLYRGKLYWFWGDTFGPASFNGEASGATSELPGKGGLDPEIGIDLNYFINSEGLNKGMCAIPGPGLKWIDWLVVLPDENREEHLYAKYSVTKTLDLDYERGIALFNDSLQVFEPLVKIDKWLDKVHSSGHPLRVRSDSIEYFYIFDRYGIERVAADINHIINPESYEHFTCLMQGSKYNDNIVKLERDLSGKIVYGWKSGTDAISPRQQNELITSGKLLQSESWLRSTDVLSGNNVSIGPSSVFWNNFRKRWIMIASENFGGAWFLEGDTPTGPWIYGTKIVGHNNYDFYNIGQHPLFDQDNGRLIYFEGTYTMGFSGAKTPTPLYDYNQMMYRLALDDKRLSLPAPVYLIRAESNNEQYMMRESVDSLGLWEDIQSIPFFALPPDHNFDGSIPVYAVREKEKITLQVKYPDHQNLPVKPLFYALPDLKSTNFTPDGTWECEADGWPLEMELWSTGAKITGTIRNEPLIIKKGSILKETIELFIEDTTEHRSYIFKARLTPGNLDGEFRGINNEEKGIFSGEHTVFGQQQFSSPMVVPLYEFKDRNGSYFYSIKSEQEGLKRSEKPVCLVWKNPSSVLELDYKAKPVPLIR